MNNIIETFVQNFGNTALLSAFIVLIITNTIKPFYKKKLAYITDIKIYDDKLSDLCFFTTFLLSIIATSLYFYIAKMSFTVNLFAAYSLSIVTGTELLYTLYEKIGLKNLLKQLLLKLKQ
ncbi:MAG: hypothetical protein RR307_02830 [Clostridia bacterium]